MAEIKKTVIKQVEEKLYLSDLVNFAETCAIEEFLECPIDSVSIVAEQSYIMICFDSESLKQILREKEKKSVCDIAPKPECNNAQGCDNCENL